ncbi:hypothetical protein MBM09_08905 [Flaviramulus sp. BrNp1-15]|uniref:hypothetical protein n=1 Tax=Flaviramulus sp. BrNp1-15 TaxID=2916754 RepID=UPI001EE9A19C|nr:hypothetical protein [Flaviramulus sp. BrNp1-15]ULC58038.1 hypothetical protein MBM09_08905 [Flaviramulus sp. BrNp1-15]
MKKFKTLLRAFLLMLSIGFIYVSCEPDNHALGKTLDKSEIEFEIVQDFAVDPGGNTVIMTNQTPEVTLTWDYGTGRSNKKVETVKYAFKGDYTIKILAVTAGGIVELDPVTITVTDDNLSYVDDPLWTALSGGVGNSKTWYLDLDAEGTSKYFGAPMAFSGNELGWEKECVGNPDDGLCWIWEPELAGNEWIADPGDYGYMTFSLDGGPFVEVNHNFTTTRGTENGTYFLDADAHTLTLTDAAVLQNSWADNDVDDWSNYQILTLTEDAMQLAAYHNSKEEFVIFNFISEEYSDNWVPQDLPDPNPPIDLDGDTVDVLLSTTTTTSKTWYLSPDTPFNWTDLEGNFLNNWNSVEDYEAAGWPGYTSADQSIVVENKITFSNDGTVSTIDSNGVEMAGNYSTTTDGTNIITFTDITPSFPIGSSWATVSTTAENQWKIVKTLKTDGIVKDIWFGKRDPDKSEYMVFHFVLEDDSTGGEELEGTEVAFDNSKLLYGDLEGNGNLRLEIYNEFGGTISDPGINPADLSFSESIEVTFTLSGITLNSGAVGSYDGSIYYADADWSPNGNGAITNVTGDGTYTVSYAPGTAVEGVIVFIIDMAGMGTDIADLSAVTATIDSIVIK